MNGLLDDHQHDYKDYYNNKFQQQAFNNYNLNSEKYKHNNNNVFGNEMNMQAINYNNINNKFQKQEILNEIVKNKKATYYEMDFFNSIKPNIQPNLNKQEETSTTNSNYYEKIHLNPIESQRVYNQDVKNNSPGVKQFPALRYGNNDESPNYLQNSNIYYNASSEWNNTNNKSNLNYNEIREINRKLGKMLFPQAADSFRVLNRSLNKPRKILQDNVQEIELYHKLNNQNDKDGGANTILNGKNLNNSMIINPSNPKHRIFINDSTPIISPEIMPYNMPQLKNLNDYNIKEEEVKDESTQINYIKKPVLSYNCVTNNYKVNQKVNFSQDKWSKYREK